MLRQRTDRDEIHASLADRAHRRERDAPGSLELDRSVRMRAVERNCGPQVSERGFFEYHLYEVNRPVTVRNNQTKQIEFVTSTGITTTTFFVYDGSGISFGGYGPVFDQAYGSTGQTKVNAMLEFFTGKKNNLDAPLPAGVVRIFKPDEDGAALLIGEDSIDHTPKGEKIQLYVGDAFDIVGERTQTDFKRLGDKVVEETFTEQAPDVRVALDLAQDGGFLLTFRPEP